MDKSEVHIYKPKYLHFSAIQFNGENVDTVNNFTNNQVKSRGKTFEGDPLYFFGSSFLLKGQYLIKGVDGQISLMSPSVFEQYFEAV